FDRPEEIGALVDRGGRNPRRTTRRPRPLEAADPGRARRNSRPAMVANPNGKVVARRERACRADPDGKVATFELERGVVRAADRANSPGRIEVEHDPGEGGTHPGVDGHVTGKRRVS